MYAVSGVINIHIPEVYLPPVKFIHTYSSNKLINVQPNPAVTDDNMMTCINPL